MNDSSLERAFDSIDTNRNGTLSMDELETAIKAIR